MDHQLSTALLLLGEAKHTLIKDEQFECSSSAGTFLTSRREVRKVKRSAVMSSYEPKKRSSLYYHFIESKDRLMFLVFSFLLTFSLAYTYSVELIFLYRLYLLS
jgi:hypothetical protein